MSTCQRYRYTFIRNDLAFAQRVRASRQIVVCVCLMLMDALTKLMVIRTSQECVALLSKSLVTEFERVYLKGWEDGCEHAWLSAGLVGPFPGGRRRRLGSESRGGRGGARG